MRRPAQARILAGGACYALEIVDAGAGPAQQALDQDFVGVGLYCFGFGAPIDVCRAIAGSGVPFDQMIEEGTWVHLSFDPKLRRQILTKAPGWGYRPGLRDD